MIRLIIEVQQHGETISTSYHAEEDPLNATSRECKTVDEIANAIQKHIAKKGGTGKFVAKPPRLVTRLGLWDYFVRHHDLHLLDSELNDIIVAVRALKE